MFGQRPIQSNKIFTSKPINYSAFNHFFSNFEYKMSSCIKVFLYQGGRHGLLDRALSLEVCGSNLSSANFFFKSTHELRGCLPVRERSQVEVDCQF